jgi:Squalene-hopene cyclase C-terminal domain
LIKEFMKSILTSLLRRFAGPQLTPAAKEEMKRDAEGLPTCDPGASAVVTACTDWLCNAQDQTSSCDYGVARDFSLQKGWASSYPETTGYIVPTILELARRTDRNDLRERGRRMLDWLVKIQFPEGGFMGGKIDAQPQVPVTFNTGQILLGLAAGVQEFGDIYRPSMEKAAGWLRNSLDEDGCWRKHPTPFAKPGEKAYETHVSWGLFEAARVSPGQSYGEAGLRQVYWAMTKQSPNGWWDSCCLSHPEKPLTHTMGYVLRGVLEGYMWSEKADLLAAARRTADGLLGALEQNGRLPARLDRNFRAASPTACLTGIVQIAHCWLLLYRLTGEVKYLEAGKRANSYVRRTVHLDGPPETRGGVKGSFPVNGTYGQWEFLNWAVKFCIDSQLIELDLAGDCNA